MNIILETILKKMCEFGGHDFDDFKWLKDDKHINTRYKYEDSNEKFIEWLGIYMRGLKISELRNIVDFPYLYYRKKKQCIKFANSFEFNYGFKTYKRDIKTERIDKIKKLTDDIT